MTNELYIIGLMSGTSLDGLDIAYCRFFYEGESIRYELLAAETTAYPDEWARRLSSLDTSSALEYALADVELGRYFGRCVQYFRARHPGRVDYIASHGHTIFHQPQRALTTQIGDGDAIAAETRLPVISRFRNLDVALGGQGAPLVPIGDKMLFSNYDACLNLGGFSNISFEAGGRRVAFDVSPCNMALNMLSAMNGKSYDMDGLMAHSGNVVDVLLSQLQSLEYYALPAPKSLGREWFVETFQPLLLNDAISVEDRLCTVVEHVALQVSSVLSQHQLRTMIVTGGGAKNAYLVERFKALAPHCQITVPDVLVVDYKEALIFALLGYLRVLGNTNTLRSVTGAVADSIGGVVSGVAPSAIS